MAKLQDEIRQFEKQGRGGYTNVSSKGSQGGAPSPGCNEGSTEEVLGKQVNTYKKWLRHEEWRFVGASSWTALR